MASSNGHNTEYSSHKVSPAKEISTSQDVHPPTQSTSVVMADVSHPSTSGEAQPKKRTVSFEELRKSSVAGLKMTAASDVRDHAAARDDNVDSSADERTGILARARGGNRDYRTAGATSSNNISSTSGGGGDGGRTTGMSATQNSKDHNQAQSGWLKRRKGKKVREGEEQEKREGWWSTLLENYGSVELENKGSVARDHLALERTFLAWLRTSLSFASIGIAVTQLFRLNISLQDSNSSPKKKNSLYYVGKPLGATFIAIAIIILFIGFHRYFESQHYVIRGRFPASRGSIFVVTLVAGALIIVSLVVILSLASGTFG